MLPVKSKYFSDCKTLAGINTAQFMPYEMKNVRRSMSGGEDIPAPAWGKGDFEAAQQRPTEKPRITETTTAAFRYLEVVKEFISSFGFLGGWGVLHRSAKKNQ